MALPQPTTNAAPRRARPKRSLIEAAAAATAALRSHAPPHERSKRLKTMQGTPRHVDVAAREAAAASEEALALELLGFRGGRPALVEVWDRVVAMVDAHVTKTPDAVAAGLDAERRAKLTQISSGAFPRAVVRVLEHWVDALAWDAASLRREVAAVFASDFIDADYYCGAAPLLLALAPFDPAVLARDPWCAASCVWLARSYDRKASILPHPRIRNHCLRRVLALHTHPGPKARVFRFRRRLPQHTFDAATGQVVREVGGVFLETSRAGGADGPAAAGAGAPDASAAVDDPTHGVPNVAGDDYLLQGVGGTPVQVLPCVFGHLTPRDLRSAEVVCKAWAAAVYATPPLCRSLRIGAFVRNRFVRFFEDAWGDEGVDVVVVSQCRAEALMRLGITGD